MPPVDVLLTTKLWRTGTNAERLFRLLRHVSTYGVFANKVTGDLDCPDTTTFRNNRLSATLREDHPESQKHLVRCLLFWLHLWDTLRVDLIPESTRNMMRA